jgi:hypothetical protein
MKFSSALHFDRKVSVRVSIPIAFSAKAPVPESLPR